MLCCAARLQLLAVCALLTCCGGSEATDPEPTGARVYTVELNGFTVREDCDDVLIPISDSNEEGEFAYQFRVVWPDGSQSVLVETPSFPSRGDGSALGKGGKNHVFTFNNVSVSREFTTSGLPMTVHFAATEWDEDLLGYFPDSRMNGAKGEASHRLRSTSFATGFISLGDPRSQCHLEAIYFWRIAVKT